MALKIGLVVGSESAFPHAFIEAVSRRDPEVTAELVKIGAPGGRDPVGYAVIVDRASHEVPFYRTYLKHAVLQGVTVINNPFVWMADDRYFAASLAERLGVAVPRTVLLPHKEYGPGIAHEESLRNLAYPLDWNGIVERVGLPCVLKTAHRDGADEAHVCNSVDELLHHFDHSGRRLTVVQEHVRRDRFVRCLVLGQAHVLPMEYDPVERRYRLEDERLPTELRSRVIADSLALVRALGHDVGSIDWAVRDGIPYAVDLLNPTPRLDLYSLTPHYFDWAVGTLAEVAIRAARAARPAGDTPRWAAWMPAHRPAPGERLTGGSDDDGAGDLAEELPSLARDLPRSQL